jgi:hypothetical protein
MLEAWRQGETAKANGVACSCYSCRKAKEAKEAIYAGSGDSIHLAPDLGVV